MVGYGNGDDENISKCKRLPHGCFSDIGVNKGVKVEEEEEEEDGFVVVVLVLMMVVVKDFLVVVVVVVFMVTIPKVVLLDYGNVTVQ